MVSMVRMSEAKGGSGLWAGARVFGLAVLALIAGLMVLPSGARAQAPAYVLGPNDAISVIVYGQGEFNVSTRVKPDGSIVMPLIGKVQAQGKTVITLADEITKRLEAGNYLKDPIVNVEVSQYNSRYVRVAGKVGRPSLVSLDRSNHLLDILLMSGWVSDAGSEFVTIIKADGKSFKVNTKELARGSEADVMLDPGDTVYIADAELVYLTGAVARPGAYALKPGMSISELLATAGGVGPTGSSGKFGLKRGEAKEIDVDTKFKLEAGDVVDVRERLF